MTAIRTHLFTGFDDPRCRPAVWNKLLTKGDTDSADLTWQWQQNWWETFGTGRLLLMGAESENELLAIAPFFTAGGMVYNICPENRLDFVGDISRPEVLDALLATAKQQVPDFLGFRFYFVPDDSRTGHRLQRAATRLGLDCLDENNIPSPILDIRAIPTLAHVATRKKSLVRHENHFRREGALEVQHTRDPDAIAPHLDAFFEQHVERRAATPNPSLFNDPRQRDYYRKIVEKIGPTGWLRFTRLVWEGLPIAFHMGLCYRGRYTLGIPSFAISLASHSPGEVLLRQLLLAAIDEGADCFDFGIGDEAYKYRFANRVPRLHTWGLYMSTEAAAEASY